MTFRVVLCKQKPVEKVHFSAKPSKAALAAACVLCRICTLMAVCLGLSLELLLLCNMQPLQPAAGIALLVPLQRGTTSLDYTSPLIMCNHISIALQRTVSNPNMSQEGSRSMTTAADVNSGASSLAMSTTQHQRPLFRRPRRRWSVFPAGSRQPRRVREHLGTRTHFHPCNLTTPAT